MRITPIAGALGADIEDVTLGGDMDDTVFSAVRDAVVRYGVVAVRGQSMSPAEIAGFARRFGDIHYHPHVGGMPDQPEVMEILKTEKDTTNFGAGWHTDQQFLASPANFTMLYGVEIPEVGGDTLFACMRGAYKTLSAGMQAVACGQRSLNLSVAAQMARRSQSAQTIFASMAAKDAPADEELAVHPVVRRRPETGEPALYIGIHTLGLVDFADDEAKTLIDFWLAHMTRPENTCRLRWRPGTLAIWDNRSVIHNALNDYQGKRRRMHRVTIVGDATEAYAEAA